ncbi:MAG TPA: DNA-processing protein DprA [Gemmatimonadales bacterium]|nr:DNA-processing protein DprA [Gemmatimonadales bacterium]
MELERAAYVALALTSGVGAARMRALLAARGSASAVLITPRDELLRIPGVNGALASAIAAQSVEEGQRTLQAVAGFGAAALLPTDNAFPAALRDIPDPPLLLFALGRLALLARPAVAIVGSRDHSPYGAEICRHVATVFARSGGAVVSGMARGLDATAHQAALDAHGATIGVLGNGLGVVYPAANRALYERVAHEGLLLTEFPPGERPNAGSFPRRNRLVSGLARVTLIVEAAEGSGALITASSALEQGRDVMAVPGPITSPTSDGTNRLIRDGAHPYLEPADLFQLFPELAPPPELPADPAPPLPEGLSEPERTLAGSLGDTAMHPDLLAVQLRRPVHELLAQLATLEIEGVVEREPGGMFRLRRATR